VAGGLKYIEVNDLPKEDRPAFGAPSGLPVLKHGDLKISQSSAIQSYVANIAPNFECLSPQQRAMDDMFAGILEDLIALIAKTLFSDKTQGLEAFPKVIDRWYPVIEALLPSDGFVNGQEFPTGADLVVLCIDKAFLPFGAADKYGGANFIANYPKMKALAQRTALVPCIREYLATSKSIGSTMADL